MTSITVHEEFTQAKKLVYIHVGMMEFLLARANTMIFNLIHFGFSHLLCMCVCMCACEREREAGERINWFVT